MKLRKKISYLLIIVLLFATNSVAQKLVDPLGTPSFKKTTYITLDDGTEIQCNLKNFKYEKGLIEEVKIVNLEGKKVKIKPEEIKHMYLPVSGIEKIAKVHEMAFDATKWANTDLKNDILEKGYVYFEKSTVKIKKKTEVLILQLLNPDFSGKIKIYHDPRAKETASLGIGGIKVAGGNAKSYFVKKDDVAYKLEKKDYTDEFKLFFSNCSYITDKYGSDPKWSDFVEHIFEYTKNCN